MIAAVIKEIGDNNTPNPATKAGINVVDKKPKPTNKGGKAAASAVITTIIFLFEAIILQTF